MNRIEKATLVSILTAVLVACGGGSSGATAQNGSVEYSDMIPLSFSPDNLSTTVERDAEISVQFSADLLPTSANSNALRLRRSDESVSGSVSLLTSDTIGFTPDKPLDLLTVYHPSITSEIADIDGRPFEVLGDGEWEFLTRDGTWGETTKVAEGAIENPLLIDEGDSMSSFLQSDNLSSGQNDLFYIPEPLADGSWATRELVSNGFNDGDVVGSVNVKRLSNGDLLAVWQELSDDGMDEIWYNRYTAATQFWGKSARVTLDNYNKLRPRLVSNASDSVFLLFDLEDSISMATDLMTIGYSAADDQWLSEKLIANDLDADAGSGQASIAMDSAGNMMVLWFSNAKHARARYYNAKTTVWGSVKVFNQDNAGETFFGSQIIVDSQDNFIAAWSQFDTTWEKPFIWSSRFSPVQGWGEAHQIIGSILGYQPVMQVNKDNNIILIYQNTLPGEDNLLFAGYNFAQNEWTNAALLDSNDHPASQPALVVDRSGNFMAIWNQNRVSVIGDVPAVWTRRFDNNTTDGKWLSAHVISPFDGAVGNPVMAVNSSGEIMALWEQIIDGQATIQGRYFD
jgi:hypothetical protein